MLKLNNKHRSWVVLAVLAWLALLAAIIFIPLTKAASGAQTSFNNSLEQTLQHSTPAEGDATVGQLVDPSRVYDAAKYAGYISLCPSEPPQLVDSKMEQLGLAEEDVNLTGQYGYMILLPADNSDVALDRVNLETVNICTAPMDQPYPLNTPLPFYMDNATWTLGANAQ